MSDTLKIMVRETKTERRALTREEAYAWATLACNLWLSDDAGIYLESIGFVEGIYEKNRTPHGSAEFCTELVRDAKPREIDAWHVVQRNLAILPSACYRCKLHQAQYTNAKKILEDKEIILEVIPGDD